MVGDRITAETEAIGLDVPEMGMEGYTTEPVPD